jgi:protoporphyrinogen oxidase
VRIAIVGAGAGGLAAAYDLVREGNEVVVFETAGHVGGLAAGFKDENWDWSVEQYYHHWFASDAHMLGLIDELGWRERVIFKRPFTVVYHEGRFYPLDSAMAVLRFPGLPFFDRLRLGVVVAYLKYIAAWEPLEHVTADAWLRRWVGERAYRILWEPLLVGKFGPHYRDVNMAWFWARIKARTPRLGTYEGGFQAFMDDLAEELRALGVMLHLETAVQKIEASHGGIAVHLPDGEQQFDHCLVTTSPALLAKLAPGLPAGYLADLLQLKSMGAVVLILALTQPLSPHGYYWHSLPKSAGFPYLSLVEHTNFLPGNHFGGEHIIYIGDYLDPGHEYFKLTKDELLNRFLPTLSRFNPEFEPGWVRKSWMFRTAYAQPVPPVNHAQSIPALDTPLPGLWLASMSQVYPWDRGTNFAVQIARRAARAIMDAG